MTVDLIIVEKHKQTRKIMEKYHNRGFKTDTDISNHVSMVQNFILVKLGELG